MEGAQSPVDPSLVGSFAFFLHRLREILTNFFSWIFPSFKQPKSSFLFFEFFGRLKEEKI